MQRILGRLALSASALALSAGAAAADYTLNILHINDWHSRIESNNKFESTCSAEEEGKGECFGGAARLVTAIGDRRKALEGQNVLLLNGGDNFQGSLFYTTYKGTAEAEFLNLMRFDAMTVGNHEFDDGEEALVPFLDKIGFPVLSANVSATAASKVGDRIKPSVVLDMGGEKIGIVGAVTNDTPEIASPGPNIQIRDDIETITAEVKKLEGQGVDKIIALTHVGYPRDKELIAKIPGVDVVVGGHSHSLLSNTDADAEGPYPTMIDNPGGYKVPVTQAASYSKYLGEFRVVFDDAGVVKEAKGDPLVLDKEIKPDEAVLKRVAELGAPIEELKNKVVAESAAAIDGSRETCRAQECAMGNLITDAMIDRTKDQGVTIAVQNGGGIRASIDAGPVTMGEVLTVLPFQNTLATFQLTGKDLVASLEAGVSEIEEGKGKFPQVGGMRYTLDTSKAPNAGRVGQVEVMENGAFAPIDENKLYTIATNNFVRGGGDDYQLFEDNAQNAYDYGPSLEQVVADYLAANQPYQPKVEGRITVAQAAATEPAPAVEPAPAEPAAEAAPTETDAAPPAAGEAITLPALPEGSGAITSEPPAAAAPVEDAQGAPEASNPAAQDSLPSEPAEPEVVEQPAAPAAEPAPAVEAEPAAPAGEAQGAPEASNPDAEDSLSSEPAEPEVVEQPAVPAAEPAADPAAPEPVAPAGEAQGAPEANNPDAEDSLSSEPAEPEVVEQPAAATPAEAAPADTAEPAQPAAPAAPAAEAAPAGQPTTHMVAAGDSLWTLAERFYGDGKRWTEIAAANPGIDPDRLEVGTTLQIPAAN